MKIRDKLITLPTSHPYITLISIFIISIMLLPGLIGFDTIPVLKEIDALKDIGGINQDNSNEGYLGDLSVFAVKSEYEEEVFGGEDAGAFIAVEADNIYSPDAIKYVQKLHQAIEKIKGVDDIKSVINVEEVTGINDEIRSIPLIEKDQHNEPIIPQTEEELRTLRTNLENNDTFETVIYSKKRNEDNIPVAWNIAIKLKESKRRKDPVVFEIEDTVEELRNEQYKAYVFGKSVLSKEINNSGIADLMRQMPLIIFVICLIYFLNFRSPSGVIFPIIGNLISAYWTFAIIGYTGIKLAFIHLLIMPLLVAIGSSYAIHLLNQYYKEVHNYRPENKREQVGNTIKHILKTIVLAGLTTIIGISSNITSSLQHLKTFALFGSIGVTISVLMALTFIPSLLSIKSIPKFSGKKKTFNDSIFDKAVDKFNRFTINHKGIIFIVVLIIIHISIVGVFFVSNEISNTDYFVEGHKVKTLTRYFSDNFDGIETMSVIIDTNPEYENSAKNEIERRMKKPKPHKKFDDTLNEDVSEQSHIDDAIDPFSDTVFDDAASDDDSDPFSDTFGDIDNDYITEDLDIFEANKEHDKALDAEFLKKIEKLAEYAESLEGVGKTFSFVDVMKRLNYIMHNDRPEYKKVPDTDQAVIDYTYMFGGDDDNFDGLPDAYETMIDPKKNIVKITMKLKNIGNRDITSKDHKRISRELTEYIEGHFDTGRLYYFFTGGSIALMTVQNYVVSGQIISIIFSLMAISIMIMILFRSFKMGLIAIIPLGTAVLINFGVMGIIGIKLNMATALISSFAIGIGIDDTIHFLLNLRRQLGFAREKGEKLDRTNVKSIVYNTLRDTSKAIIFTSLALIFGFTVLALSSFIPIKDFSSLVALTMINATLATLMFLPSIIVLMPFLVRNRKDGHI